MTLDELKKQYERFSEMAEKRGQVYCDNAEDAKEKGNYENASLYYNLASTAYNEATIYRKFVNDLNEVYKTMKGLVL